MASTGHGQRDPQRSSDLLARVGVFVGLFGIGLSTLLATVAVQERLGPLWFTLLLSLSIALVLGGGAGSICSLVIARSQSTSGKLSWRAFHGSRKYRRTTAIAAGVLTGVILAVSLLFIVFRTGTPLIKATSTSLTTSPASGVIWGTEVALTAVVTPAEAAGTVQFKNGTTNIGNPVLVTNGTASVTTPMFVDWPQKQTVHQLAAVFAPTNPATYLPSTSPPMNFLVVDSMVPTSTRLAISPASPVTHGIPVTLTAAVTPAEAAGTVQFKDGTSNIGNPVLVTNGTASRTTSTLAVGSHQLTAVFIPTNPAFYGTSTPPKVTVAVTALPGEDHQPR